tara:strand:+ start:8409 stop:8861 length:453 start_codon:yes stop_codon:yes gene_type:complete
MADQNLIFTLDGGDVTIRLRDDLAPQHTARISQLAEDGFYDGLTFHRVIDGFVAQGGCPQGNGTGGTGQKIPAEFSSEKHVRGSCSMARTSDPNSADCQIFICLDEVPYLDNQYTVWGEVIDGMEHVDALPKGEPPREPGKIHKARLEAA